MFEQGTYFDDEIENEKFCPRCNLSLSEFSRLGIAGCAYCYEIFNVEVNNLLLQKQGTFNHVGKISSKHISKIKIKEKIEILEKQKEEAAKQEDFIVAESLKNQIEKLRGELWYERL